VLSQSLKKIPAHIQGYSTSLVFGYQITRLDKKIALSGGREQKHLLFGRDH